MSLNVFSTCVARLIQAVHMKITLLACALQVHCSSTNCTRELFKTSKDSASLHACNEKNFVFRFWIFCEWHHKSSSFRPFWPTSSGSGPKLL